MSDTPAKPKRVRKKKTYADRIRSAARMNQKDCGGDGGAFTFQRLFPTYVGRRGVHLSPAEVNELAKVLGEAKDATNTSSTALAQIYNFLVAGVVPGTIEPSAQAIMEKIAHLKAKRDELTQKSVDVNGAVAVLNCILDEHQAPQTCVNGASPIEALGLRLRAFCARRPQNESAEIARLKRIIEAQKEEIYHLSGFPSSSKKAEPFVPFPALAALLLLSQRPTMTVEEAMNIVRQTMKEAAEAFAPLRIFKIGDPQYSEELKIAGKTAA